MEKETEVVDIDWETASQWKGAPSPETNDLEEGFELGMI